MAFEGTWEQALEHQAEFAGKQVRVEVVPEATENPNDLPFEEWKARYDAAVEFVESNRGKLGPLPEGATTSEKMYD